MFWNLFVVALHHFLFLLRSFYVSFMTFDVWLRIHVCQYQTSIVPNNLSKMFQDSQLPSHLGTSIFVGFFQQQVPKGPAHRQAPACDLPAPENHRLRADHAPDAVEVHGAAQGFDALLFVRAVGLVVLEGLWPKGIGDATPQKKTGDLNIGQNLTKKKDGCPRIFGISSDSRKTWSPCGEDSALAVALQRMPRESPTLATKSLHQFHQNVKCFGVCKCPNLQLEDPTHPKQDCWEKTKSALAWSFLVGWQSHKSAPTAGWTHPWLLVVLPRPGTWDDIHRQAENSVCWPKWPMTCWKNHGET